MLTLKSIQRTMDKLNRGYENGEAVEGEIVFEASRDGENRYSYYYKGQLVFTLFLSVSYDGTFLSKRKVWLLLVSPVAHAKNPNSSIMRRARCICNGRNIDVCIT